MALPGFVKGVLSVDPATDGRTRNHLRGDHAPGANAAHRHALHPLTILTALIGLLLISVSILVCYVFADRLAQMLGATGMTVITRLTSFFLVCIGVQITSNGVKALLESVTPHVGW